jgi:hypothetical protein
MPKKLLQISKIFDYKPDRQLRELFNLALCIVRLDTENDTKVWGILPELPLIKEQRNKLEKLFHLLIHTSTLMNKTFRATDQDGYFISDREDYINALELMKDLLGLYNKKGLKYEYELLMLIEKEFGRNGTFKAKELQNTLYMSKSHTHRILEMLMHRSKIKRIGGTKRKGYIYQLTID